MGTPAQVGVPVCFLPGVVRVICFAFTRRTFQIAGVTQPLALIFYEDLMPGTQLVNRLQDLHYRVQPLTGDDDLAATARKAGPMLVFADLVSKRTNVCATIAALRASPETVHVPVIAFADEAETALQESARVAGATLVVTDAAILTHLEQFIERALHVE